MIHFLGSAESCFAYCRRDVYSLDLRQPPSVRSAFAAGSFSDRILDPEPVSPSYDFSESRPVQRAFCVCTGPWAPGSSWRFFFLVTEFKSAAGMRYRGGKFEGIEDGTS